MKMNKKGFTLVELLAVIVILAIVMLVGVTAVGPILTKSRQNAILDEGAAIVDGAMLAYESNAAFGGISITNGTVYDLANLTTAGFYTKKNSNLLGCFKIVKEDNGNIEVRYSLYDNSTKYGITNGTVGSTIDAVNDTDRSASLTNCATPGL